MMHRIELVAWLALASTAAASAINARNCLQLEVPVSVAVNNYKILQPKIYSDSGMAEWLWDVTSWSGPNLTERLIGIDPIDEIFNVHAQLCVPPQGKRAGILQLATHGGGFDSRCAHYYHSDCSLLTSNRYWDVAIKPEQYSYVDATIAEGYSILTYDRLGTGQSDHPEANKVQSPVHIAIIKGLTDLARAGKLAQYSTTKGSIVSKHYKPSKIVHVGHSIGSYLTNGFLSAYGNLSDGAILTGFLYSSKLGVVGPGYFDFQYARDQDPYLFGDRGEGYFVQGSKTAIKFNFLKYGTYEPELAQYGYDVRQTFTGSELYVYSFTAFLVVEDP